MNTQKTKKRRKSNNLGYYVREGFRGIFSHGFMSAAAITIIAACLLITGSFSLVALNIEYNLSQLMAENEFLAYVDESLTEEEARAIQPELEALDNVASVTFISRSEAKENYLAGINADDDLYASLPDSVLRHRYSISVTDIAQLSSTIQAVCAVDGIADYSAALEVANGFVTIRNVVAVVAIGMVAVLFVISLFIISNAIKLATLSRQEEIAIMKMCGATNGFIRMPFVFEGILLGLSSALIGFACQWGLYELLIQAIHTSSRMQLVSIIPFARLAPVMGGVFAGVGLLVGVCGSLMTIRKYLQV
jgi:cell division transport system permease protein